MEIYREVQFGNQKTKLPGDTQKDGRKPIKPFTEKPIPPSKTNGTVKSGSR